jgi:sugar phosphate permease
MPLPARYVMHCLLGSAYGMNILMRNSVNFIVPFVVKARGFSSAQAAMLLAGFYPGYVIMQIPAGLIARSVGEKTLTTINCIGNGLFFLLLPAVSAWGALPLAVCLTAMGFFQGAIVPCMVGMQVITMLALSVAAEISNVGTASAVCVLSFLRCGGYERRGRRRSGQRALSASAT